MAGLLNSVVNLGKGVLQRMQVAPSDPHQVRPVNAVDLAPVATQDRHGCLVFYGPRRLMRPTAQPRLSVSASLSDEVTVIAEAEAVVYELVAHAERGGQSFSLHRFQDIDLARETFLYLRERLPLLLAIDTDLCTQVYLQLFCDALRKNPSLSLAHLAVMFDLKIAVVHKDVTKLYNVVDNDGVSPLMLAVQKENAQMIRLLVAKGAKLDSVDKDKNSIFHYAANTNKDIVQALGDSAPASVLNACNTDGNTPLHIACKNDKPDCVQALLCMGADVNVTGTLDDEYPIQKAMESSSTRCVKEIIQMYPKQLHTQDIKNGGTPLHWAKSREIIDALVDSGCQVDAKNFQGHSALHVMVKHERLDCVMALITHSAQVDARDNAGNTALLLAVDTGNVSVVRALLVFDADTTACNQNGDTAWRLARRKCDASGLMDFRDWEGVLYALYAVGAAGSQAAGATTEKHEEKFAKIKRQLSPQHRRVRWHFDEMLAKKAKLGKSGGDGGGRGGDRLLSLDGGGIKGVVLTRMLLSMERLLETPITHCFDWIAGTSTGGILALGLVTGKTVIECQILYLKLKDRVFIDSKPYSTKPLEELLQQEFGIESKMADIHGPKVMVTATIANRTPPDLHLFRNYPAPQDMLGVADYAHPDIGAVAGVHCKPSEQPIWRAARATGAAPSFFRPEGSFVDGGILANNPSIDLMKEIAEFNMAKRAMDHEDELVKPAILVSLGTGVPPVKKTKVVDIFRPDSASDTIKLMMNWDGMGRLMLDSVLDADGRVVDQTRAWCLSTNTSYHRLAPMLQTDVELDEKDDKVLVDLMWITMAYMHEKREEVKALKSALIV